MTAIAIKTGDWLTSRALPELLVVAFVAVAAAASTAFLSIAGA